MSKKKLSRLLTELSDELQHADDLDDETRELLEQLHDDIDRLAGDSHATAVERARSLRSQFAANHPVAERIAREIGDLLAKMGI